MRVVLCLERIVHQFLRANSHTIRQIRLFMLLRARIVYVSVLVLIGSRNKREELIIFDSPVYHLDRIFHMPIAETVSVVAGCCYADHQLVPVAFLSILEQSILLRLFISGYFIRDREVTVERVLTVRIGCQRIDVYKAIRSSLFILELILNTVIEAVIQDPHVLVFIESVISHIEFEEVERLQRLLEAVCHDVLFRAGSPPENTDRKRQRSDP